MEGHGESRRAPRGIARFAARVIVWLRFLIVPAWIVAAVLAAIYLPPSFGAGTGSVGDLVSSSSPALQVERSAERTFGLPLLSRTMAVAVQPGGLSKAQLAAATRYIARVDRAAGPRSVIQAALPLTAIRGLERGAGSTMIAYLYIDPGLDEGTQTAAARRFANGLGRAGHIPQSYVTGSIPAQFRDGEVSNHWLRWVELATVLLVVGILGLYFRAVGIPLLGLATVAIAYVVADHLLGWLAAQGVLSAPTEVQPVLIAILFGTLTDYVVFFTSGYRRRLASGLGSGDAATEVTAELLPVVLTAGLMIAGATLTLLLSGVDFLGAFGPGLAVAVLVGVAVAVTFVPAALGAAGPLLLRPHGVDSVAAHDDAGRPRQGRLVGFAARHPAMTTIVCVLPLVAAASGILHLRIGDTTLRGLPSDTSEHRGYDAAARAFAPGVADPTMVVLSERAIANRRARLAKLQSRIAHEPGIASVVGPGSEPPRSPSGIFRAPSGDAARLILILDSDPAGATATGNLARLEQRLPRLLGETGLGRARVGIAGDTAITSELADDMRSAFLRVGPAAIALLMLLLWALLRSRTAPLYLTAVSVLVVVAALGLTVYVFQDLLGYGEIAFFVPITSAIILVALGSDYNVFLVGRIWLEADRRELRGAVRTAGSRAARAIAVAGVILALSFAALALIPTQAFRELAFAMCVGLLIDAFIARTLLIPALIVLFGRGVREETEADLARSQADRQEDEAGHHSEEESHRRARERAGAA